MTLEESSLDGQNTRIFSTNCQSTVRRNWFLDVSAILTVSGGNLEVTNNLFTVPDELADAISLNSISTGSVFAFNTIVNTSTVTSSGVAIVCNATLRLTSNIVAYNSINPIEGCTATSSVFDLPGGPDAPGNLSVDANSLFVDLEGGDFHLSQTSAAIAAGEGGIVDIDIDGNPRPPSMPDVGAFELP